ncbi:hypothetical protein BDZ97DRAFT_188415 [Flammula alnicola]|nr:hypothetical protein BDZ97DRAFT_188415 [Flammula alnicola]
MYLSCGRAMGECDASKNAVSFNPVGYGQLFSILLLSIPRYARHGSLPWNGCRKQPHPRLLNAPNLTPTNRVVFAVRNFCNMAFCARMPLCLSSKTSLKQRLGLLTSLLSTSSPPNDVPPSVGQFLIHGVDIRPTAPIWSSFAARCPTKAPR